MFRNKMLALLMVFVMVGLVAYVQPAGLIAADASGERAVDVDVREDGSPSSVGTVLDAYSVFGQEFLTRLETSPLGALPLWFNVFELGTTTFEVDVDTWYGPVSVDFEMAVNNDRDEAVVRFNINVMGVAVDFALHVDSEQMALSSSLFGRDNLGIVYETFAEDFRGFLAEIGVDDFQMAYLEEVFAELEALIAILPESFANQEAMNEHFKSEIERVYLEFMRAVEGETTTATINVGGRNVEATRVQFDITDSQFIQVLDDIITAYEEIPGLAEMFASIPDADVSDVFDIYRELLDMLAEVFTGTFEEAIYIVDGRLVRAYVSGDLAFDGEYVSIEMVANTGTHALDLWDIEITASIDGDTVTIYLGWEIDGTTNTFTASISENGVFEEEGTLVLDWDSTAGTFTVAVSANDAELREVFEGRYTTDGTVFTLGFDASDFSLTMRTSLEANTAMIDFINMSDWNEALFDRIGQTIDGLFGGLMGMGGNVMMFDDMMFDEAMMEAWMLDDAMMEALMLEMMQSGAF